MKRLVTLTLLLVLGFAADASRAQVAHLLATPSAPVNIQSGSPFVMPFQQLPYAKAPMMSAPLDRQTTLLAYFDADSNFVYNWYVWPFHINWRLSNPTRDTLDIITRLAERFTSPYGTNTYLDSVTFLIGLIHFEDVPKNNLVVEVKKQYSVTTPNGPLYFMNTPAKSMDSVIFSPGDFDTTEGKVFFMTLPLKHAKVGANFFIAFHITDTTGNSVFAFRGDSLTIPGGRPNNFPDNNLDRSYMAGESIQSYMAGLTYTINGSPTDPFYPNLIMIAHVSNALPPSGVNEQPANHTALYQNYPNPFNPSTQISYQLGENSSVSLKVFNAMGEEVATLVSGNETAGSHTVTFNPTGLASGMYYYTLRAGNFTETKTMVLSK